MNSTKPKEYSYNVINGKEKQQSLTFKKPEPANVLHFLWENDWNDPSIIQKS